MDLGDERRLRSALEIAEDLAHEHLLTIMGVWDQGDAIYVVEEYATNGDLLADSLSHPEKCAVLLVH